MPTAGTLSMMNELIRTISLLAAPGGHGATGTCDGPTAQTCSPVVSDRGVAAELALYDSVRTVRPSPHKLSYC